MGKATEALKVEHELIFSTFELIDDIMKSQNHSDEIKLKYANEFLYFVNVFSDKCHHGKEEMLLFPLLVDHGVDATDGLIGIMKQDHVIARRIAVSLREAIDKKDIDDSGKLIKDYTSFLKTHITKENGILFPIADQLLDETAQNELISEFLIYEEDMVGHGIHAQLHQMIDQWIIEFELKA